MHILNLQRTKFPLKVLPPSYSISRWRLKCLFAKPFQHYLVRIHTTFLTTFWGQPGDRKQEQTGLESSANPRLQPVVYVALPQTQRPTWKLRQQPVIKKTTSLSSANYKTQQCFSHYCKQSFTLVSVLYYYHFSNHQA